MRRVEIQGHLYSLRHTECAYYFNLPYRFTAYSGRKPRVLSKDLTTLISLQIYGTRSVPTTLRYEMTTM